MVIKLRYLLKSKKYKKGYLIHKTETSYKLCKILNEYDEEKDVQEDLISLLSHKKTEEDLLEDYSKKQSW